MAAITNLEKAIEMGKRVYNGKLKTELDEKGVVKYSDDEAIKSLCSKVFSSEGEISNMEDLRSFNKIIVEVANQEAKARFEQIVNNVADYKKIGRYDQIHYLKVPKKAKVTMALSASATGVDFTKIPSRTTKIPAVPKQRQFGVKYQISEMVNDPINAFKSAVDLVVEAKLKFIFKEIMTLAKGGVTSGKIPSSQYIDQSNITLTAFRKVEDKLIRVGNRVRPILLADQLFISALANQQIAAGSTWITEDLKASLLRDISIEMVSKTIALSLDNPFIDDANSKVDLEPGEAIMLSGGDGKPFKITEYGDLRTSQDMPSIEKEEVLIKLDYVLDVTLFAGNLMAYLKDDAITV